VPAGARKDGGWTPSDWLTRDVKFSLSLYMSCAKYYQEERKMALFAQFAMAATHEALDDAAWRPTSPEQRAETVCFIHVLSG
jgi:3-oxoacyl-[acyl-carrier-protein] synthase II